jgi:hypothetical protein
MRRYQIILTAAFVLPVAALAQGGTITLHNADDPSACSISDTGLMTVAVRYDHPEGSVAVVFKVTAHGFNGWHVSDDCGEWTCNTGESSQTGIRFVYWCSGPTTNLMTITYMGDGSSDPCARFVVEPADPPVGNGMDILAFGCTNLQRKPRGGSLWINSPACDCSVPAEASTWGRIKALYE